MTDLDKLIAKVEEGEVIPMGYAADAMIDLPDAMTQRWGVLDAANRGSLDAAKRLHDALLPGWRWSVWDVGGATVWLDVYDTFAADVTDPARAWLLAILRAVKAKG